MTKQVLFIHGAGEGAYKEDTRLAQHLQKELGSDFKVLCPKMTDEINAPYDLWKQHVQEKVATMHEPIILVGHSIGASHLAKIVTEITIDAPTIGIFLLEAPFWGGRGWLYEGYEELEVPKNAAAKFPKNAKVFLYHTRDDEVVPFSHVALYAGLLPQAIVRQIDRGGHQLDSGVSLVAKDIKTVATA